MYWAEEEDQPSDLRQIIDLVRQSYSEIKWTRSWVRNPRVDEDGIRFFWLADQPGDVQIESSYGVCPLAIETDKINDRFAGKTVREVADKIIELLKLPGGHQNYFWHPR